jgi:hypothetical protein
MRGGVEGQAAFARTAVFPGNLSSKRKTMIRKSLKVVAAHGTAAVLLLLMGLAMLPGARADEAEAYAKNRVKEMSEYLAGQDVLSFAYDSTFEIVTDDEQKLALAASGMVTLDRPDKIRATRNAGFADVEMLFDGTTLTVLSRITNRYSEIEESGTLDSLIDALRDKYGQPLPGADLLLPNVHDELMAEVVDSKDLGSGVIGGVVCDHLAFRTDEVDWQIWIAQGEEPYPCRYVITTKEVTGSPQYSIQIRDWKAGDAVASETFVFDNPTNAERIALDELPGEIPDHFLIGDNQ